MVSGKNIWGRKGKLGSSEEKERKGEERNEENGVADFGADPNDPWYAAAEKVARRCAGGVLQYKAKKIVEVGGMSLLLYGRLDCLKAGEIIDIKFTKSYDTGKFFSSTQHPTYFELIPEARQFTYIASNGRDVWPETYFREDAPSIFPVISDFFDWLRAVDLMQVYQEKWATL